MVKNDKREREDLKIAVLREIASSGGLPQNRVSLEVLYLLPTDFTEKYTELFFEALREDAKGVEYESRAGEMTDKKLGAGARKRKGVKGTGGPIGPVAGEGSKRYRNAWTVRNERALRMKTDIDRDLLRLAGDIEQGLKDRTQGGSGGGMTRVAARCVGKGCGRFMRNEWRYCPSCGTVRRAASTRTKRID